MTKIQDFYGTDESYFAANNCVYTSAEIAAQPEAWIELMDTLLAKRGKIQGFLDRAGDLKRRRIIFCGAGSSAFVGDAASGFIAESGGPHCESVHTPDIVSAPGACLFDTPTLMISIARSGNSPESAGAVKYARSVIKDLFEIAVICDPDSALAEMFTDADNNLLLTMPASANDKGFAMTCSVTCMTIACYAVFNLDKLEGLAADVKLLAERVRESGARLYQTAKQWADTDYGRLIVLGSGALKGIARESALKTMELTNGAVNTSYDSPAAFRHGPKAVIKDDAVTLHIISENAFTARYDMDLLAEVYGQKKGNRVISISTGNAAGRYSDENVIIDDGGYGIAPYLCCGINALVFCQLLAVCKSISLGLPTDNPSPAGELNRVVKGVTIYELTE